MTIAELKWLEDREQWGATLFTPAFTEIELYAETSGREETPTILQKETADMIVTLPASKLPDISLLIDRWASANWEESDMAELEPDDFEYEIDGLLIPHIENVGRHYVMIYLRCELEPEHGIGLACRDFNDYSICHPETYNNLRKDEHAALDQPFETPGTA